MTNIIKTETDFNFDDDFLSDDVSSEVIVIDNDSPKGGELILKPRRKSTIDGVVDDAIPIHDNLKSSVISTDDIGQLFSSYYKKPHRFIFGQVALTSVEFDLMALLLSRIQPSHWFKDGELRIGYAPTYQFSNCVLSDFLGCKPHHLYTIIKPRVEFLNNKSIGLIDDSSKKISFTTLFKNITYENGILTMKPNDLLASDWLALAGGHAQVNNKTFNSLKRTHSKHLYELLSRFKNKGKLKTQTLTELYGQFGLLDAKGEIKLKSYKLNKTFIQKCIVLSIQDISEKESGIIFYECPKSKTFGYSAVRRGKTIVAIDFLYSWVNDEDKKLEHGIKTIERREKREEYADAVGVYSIIDNYDFEPDHPRNPTTKELAMMISRPEELLANGMELNAEFMLKYSVAIIEANRKPLIK